MGNYHKLANWFFARNRVVRHGGPRAVVAVAGEGSRDSGAPPSTHRRLASDYEAAALVDAINERGGIEIDTEHAREVTVSRLLEILPR